MGRNQPCPCGSGRKAKRCCGVERGPGAAELAAAYLAHAARDAAGAIADLDDRALAELWQALPRLPRRDLALLVALPTLISPELDRLFQAVADDDPHLAEPVLPGVVATIDTPEVRAELARALVRLRTAKRIEPRLAAAALVDLASPSQAFLRASLLEAVALASGSTRTPAGLLIAAA